MKCHQCEFNAAVQAGLYRDLPFEEIPCANCVLCECPAHVQAYDDGRVYDAGPVCEASDPYPDEAGTAEWMPVSVLTGFAALILALPPRTRDVVCMRHLGMRYAEIAQRVGATVPAVERLLARAMVKHPELKCLLVNKAKKQQRRRGGAAPLAVTK